MFSKLLKRADEDPKRCRAAYREELKWQLTNGVDASRSEGLRDVIAIGGTRFARGIRATVAGREEGLQAKRALRRRATPGEVRAIVEELRGESWRQFGRRRGDWARPLSCGACGSDAV